MKIKVNFSEELKELGLEDYEVKATFWEKGVADDAVSLLHGESSDTDWRVVTNMFAIDFDEVGYDSYGKYGEKEREFEIVLCQALFSLGNGKEEFLVFEEEVEVGRFNFSMKAIFEEEGCDEKDDGIRGVIEENVAVELGNILEKFKKRILELL